MVRGLGLTVLLCAMALLSRADGAAKRGAMKGLPDVVLWAWERPEDLRSLDGSIGVAFLVQTLIISGDHVIVRPRLQPLRVRPATPLIAVTRIEHPNGDDRPLEASGIPRLAAHIADSRRLPRVQGVQLDFDATASERDFYRALLRAVRAELGASTPLSITALASWCVGDNWLEGLPIDEAVPMLFRMGPANGPFGSLAVSRGAAARPCAVALGVSLDEPLPVARKGRRVYVFSPRSWTPESVAEARRRTHQ